MLRRTLETGLVAACVLAAPASANGSVAVGQTGVPTGLCGPGSGDWAQVSVSSGNPYVVPAIGPSTALTITSWSHEAYSAEGQKLKFKVYRQVSGMTYRVVGEDARTLTPSTLNSFPTNIAVRPGDILGITTPADSSSSTGCGFGASAETVLRSAGTDAGPGDQVTFANFGADRLNVSAVAEPTNAFAIGTKKLNRKRGTAVLKLDVPNPGELTAAGKGARAATRAIAAKSVPAGLVSLKIKARGKKRRKLNRSGKVKLTLTVTYTPVGGAPAAQSTKLKLKRLVKG